MKEWHQTSTNFLGISWDFEMKILVEVKGKKSFPYSLQPLESQSRFDRAFSQLIQEAALALLCRYWREELLIGLATLYRWYLFKIIDTSTSEDKDVKIMITISNSWYHDIIPPQVQILLPGPDRYSLNNIRNLDNLVQVISFLTEYLCALEPHNAIIESD